MSTIYIDEATDSDTTGQGTESQHSKKGADEEAKKKQMNLLNERQRKRAKNGKSVVLTEDTSLPKAIKVVETSVMSFNLTEVCPRRRYHNLLNIDLNQFLSLAGYLQVVLSGRVNQTYHALTLTLESTVELIGTLQVVPEGKTAPGGHALIVDHWQLVGAAPGAEDAFTNRLNETQLVQARLNQRAFELV
ncbi:hypothetical protein DFH05DRAFT_1464671 [Lentinula detonsa]|uniref:Uncharacterized protein n=1 Tax=Lentinula detonsa TaxID=2804962 RepID=A0A9W8TRI1_9AGAR|nr:hypothetical protein DFH05DRAFT_1464671 [Lentinula detonsa]